MAFKASVILFLRFNLSDIFIGCSHNQEIFLPGLFTRQAPPSPVSPKRGILFIAPVVTLSAVVALYLFLCCHTLSFGHSVLMQTQVHISFLSSLTVLIFFLYDDLSSASLNSDFHFLRLAWLLYFTFDLFSYVQSLLDIQAEILNMHTSQLICFSFLRDHSHESSLSNSSFFIA
uniref:Uncharacterized protein n=1 Tax=Myotis myotis TaxID=51298 RepID=A0A7J7Z4Y0_MYOMY|nr:hypothetical protein mMyoMyo1_010629 [Myotis myotis]